MDSRTYRPSTLAELHNFTRLQDALANVSWYTRCCVATDVPDNFDLDVNTAYALLLNTKKPTATSFTLAEYVEPIVKMLDIAAVTTHDTFAEETVVGTAALALWTVGAVTDHHSGITRAQALWDTRHRFERQSA